MTKHFFYFFLIIFGFLFCSDPSGKSDFDPPVPLKMVGKLIFPDSILRDTTLNESGIDAVPDEDAISVVWHSYQGINRIKKFKIYRSSDPAGDKNFSFHDEINIENNFDQDTTFLDNDINLESFYHYFVTVVDEDNRESLPSDTVKYFLIEKATPTEPNSISFNPGETILFRFFIPAGTNANGYILRIERQIGLENKELIHIEYVNPRRNIGIQNESREISTNNFQTLLNPVEYRWRVDVIAGDISTEGSESDWAYFTINWGN